MVANVRGDKAKVDFVLIQDVRVPMSNGKIKGVSLPSEEVFKAIVNKAITALLRTNIAWCNVCSNNGVNKLGIGVIQLNYGYPEGAETMRRIIEQMSTPMVSYNTYPAVDLIKRHAVTVFVHDGYDGIPTDLLGPSLKMANPDMHGDFEVIDSRTLKIEGRKDCRLLSLDCSPEFLDYLATKPRNHRYPMISHKVYINGGKRSDSLTEYTAPRLSHEDSAKLVKSHSGWILETLARKMGLGKEFTEAEKYAIIILYIPVSYTHPPSPRDRR